MTQPTTEKAPAIHPFEESGLGVGPFRCVGVETRVGPITLADGTQVGSPGQPMGSCAHCGTGIKDCYLIRSADGKRFVVGSSCVLKTNRKSLDTRGMSELERDVLREKRALDREKAAAKRDAKYLADLAKFKPSWDAARAALEADPTLCAGEPHPQISGLTLRNKYEWMLQHAGFAGRNATAACILRAAAAKAGVAE